MTVIKKYHSIMHGVDVDAVQLTQDNLKQVLEWCDGMEVVEHDPIVPENTFVGINVRTKVGMARLSEGQYLIQSPDGGFLVSGPNKFEHNFEPA